MSPYILKSDIFFVVTTIAVIITVICLTIISIYIIRILKDLKILSHKTKDEGEKILDDIKNIREDAHNKGVQINQFISYLFSIVGLRKNISRKTSKKDEKKL